MFYELAENYKLAFHKLFPFPSASSRALWNSLDESWKAEAKQLGKSYLHYEYPAISASDFLDFTRTGNRIRYEEKYFARRRALDALVLAECVENQDTFLDDIINGIFCICEESGWQLPPHNSYIRDTPQLPLPDSTKPVLDLFACETGSILATADYLLGRKLDTVSPIVRNRIRHELNLRVFTPYLEQHFWWMGDDDEPMNNWTIWCTQNILLSVFLTDTTEKLQKQVFMKACKSVDYFLAEYGEDGCCDEGALYYRHAGLCLFNTIEILDAITDGHFSCLYEVAKIKNIASYIMNVHIQDKYYLNFADCSPVAGRCSAREFLFAKRTGNKNMMIFSAQDFIAGLPDTLLLPTENNLYYRLQNAFTVKDILSYAQKYQTPVDYPDLYYPSVGVFLARDDTYFLAAKAGDNADSHNHNDTGSFVIYKNGMPLFIDVGVENYTKKTFSPQRYEIWTMQSAYHNLPTINGVMQKDGANYGATDTAVSFTDTCCKIQMNIASAYPPNAKTAYYMRELALNKNRGIQIRDTFQMTELSANAKIDDTSVILSFMTYEKPILSDRKSCLLFQIGNIGFLHIVGASFLQIEGIPITDSRLKSAWEHDIYRILVKAIDSTIIMDIQ